MLIPSFYISLFKEKREEHNTKNGHSGKRVISKLAISFQLKKIVNCETWYALNTSKEDWAEFLLFLTEVSDQNLFLVVRTVISVLYV